MLRRIGNELSADGKTTKLEVIMRKAVELAMNGTSWAIEFIADRTEGKAAQTIHQILTEFTDDTNETVQQGIPGIPTAAGDSHPPGAV